jgi:hypothetical protein
MQCRFDATLTREFTPRSAPEGIYRVFVTTARLESTASLLRQAFPGSAAASSWTVQQFDPLDGFGDGGAYDRPKVARLYTGRRVRVARGPIVKDGRVVASVWLFSPYPDPSLSRLQPGTMIIEFRTDRVSHGSPRERKNEQDQGRR